MRLVHDPIDAEGAVLATEIDVADSIPSQIRGLTFRRSIPDDYALLFEFGAARTRDIHMLFVRFPLDVVWVVDDVVERVERLRPWRGFARATADRIVELSAGAAADVTAGDRLVLDGIDA
ncbi:DUF192 domain-containing protein [Halosolutus gelatinilyticus]|uniref:DUF192 domain-containing protein n=1 Tax=Halosolutus gelatinilyticus TaxID=2931975 RepID=UPI001FF66AB2|nr:DUF192 domain-containing protein [Halosolutus gelatinilyticus]